MTEASILKKDTAVLNLKASCNLKIRKQCNRIWFQTINTQKWYEGGTW